MPFKQLNRRLFIATSAAAAGAVAAGVPFSAHATEILKKPVPKTGELIPAIGMGTSRTFNVGGNIAKRDQRAEVMKTFFAMGGGMIDSSPMYGSSEDVLGHGLGKLGTQGGLFSATKVWTPSTSHGRKQLTGSLELWGLDTFDLYQIHNLVNWEDHLAELRERKQAGRIRYIGITTSHGSRHSEFLKIMESEELDFVQFSYNLSNRAAEKRLLPLAADKGIAVIVNRPFQLGRLVDRYDGKPLPDWAAEYAIKNWAQYLLKFIISHPAVTTAIPATRRVDHMIENMTAMTGPMPDAKMRRRMIRDAGLA